MGRKSGDLVALDLKRARPRHVLEISHDNLLGSFFSEVGSATNLVIRYPGSPEYSGSH